MNKNMTKLVIEDWILTITLHDIRMDVELSHTHASTHLLLREDAQVNQNTVPRVCLLIVRSLDAHAHPLRFEADFFPCYCGSTRGLRGGFSPSA